MGETTGYQYRGLMVAAWDLLRGDTAAWPDRAFYEEAIRRGGQPALDVGCSTGRLLLDFLAAGIDIDGVDNSPEMLALCREHARQRGLAPRLYAQAMETLALPRAYRTIIVPSSSFQLVTDPRGARRAMARFRASLAPGGALVMSFMIPDPARAGATLDAEEWTRVAEATRPEDGAVVRRWSRSSYDAATRLGHMQDRYEVVRDGVVVAAEEHVRSPALRWYTQAEVTTLYQAAGFGDIRLVRAFTDEPAGPADRLFCAVGTRA